MYNSLPALVFRVIKERGEREAIGKKRLVLASLDSKSRIAMHWTFFKASKDALKACSSILLV
jgi:hypothetical protein